MMTPGEVERARSALHRIKHLGLLGKSITTQPGLPAAIHVDHGSTESTLKCGQIDKDLFVGISFAIVAGIEKAVDRHKSDLADLGVTTVEDGEDL